jgi:predicted nucleic acid-binding protein
MCREPDKTDAWAASKRRSCRVHDVIAAVAGRTSATVVHQDRDFDLLASVAADLAFIRELI